MIKNLKTHLLLAASLTLCLSGVAHSAEKTDQPLTAYYIGNSLTRNLPLERLQLLFDASGTPYRYGMQLNGGHTLDKHLSKRNHSNKPGQGTYNIDKAFGTYDEAFRKHTFDAVVLQPYTKELDAEPKITKGWPFFECGDLQAASGFIDYARGKSPEGSGRWDYDNPNRGHEAASNFYIYATWPNTKMILEQEGEKSYANYYARPYTGGIQPSADFFKQLVERLNAAHPDLKQPVRLIPAGEVLAVLDQKIRAGKLPGIEAFYKRNQPYFLKARRNNKGKSQFDPEAFDSTAGVLNFYADGIHLNDQPHNAADSGTIGSYTAALTVYTVLTGKSPVGLTAKPYEQFDESVDAVLIKALQSTVWEVVSSNPLTGVAK